MTRITRALTPAITADASPIAVSLVRLGLPLIVWTEWGEGLLAMRDLRLHAILIAMLLFGSTLLLFVGYRSRAMSLLTAVSIGVCIGQFGIIEKRDYVHHHTQLMMITALLLSSTACGNALSIDRWLATRKQPNAPLLSGPVWGQRLLCVHVSTIYLWSVFEKFSWAFLSGARMEHYYLFFYGGSHVPGGAASWIFPFAAWGTIVVEVFLAIGLWFRRTRLAAVAVGILFHLTLYYTLPVATFSIQMILLYVLFFDPAAVESVLDRLSGAAARSEPKRA
jgi:hypothetical protein